jgi:hypothetical protein
MDTPAPISKFDDEAAKRRMIAEAAYFVAERRGFAPGYAMDDWLQAEQEIEASMEPTQTIREMQSQPR